MGEHVVGDAVRAARVRHGWSLQAVADRAGLHKLQVHRIETGERKKLSTAEITALCDALELTVQELLGITRATPIVALAAARLLDKDLPVEQSVATSRAAELLNLSSRWSGVSSNPTMRRWWTVPSAGLEKDKGYEFARALRDRLGLDDEPIDDLQLLCEREFGLSVALEPLADHVRGLLVRVGNAAGEANSDDLLAQRAQGFALINTARKTPASQRFTMAHELAHYLFNDSDDGLLSVETEDAGKGNGRWMELRCDCFAAEFLAPERAVQRMAAQQDARGIRADVALSIEVARTFGVSWTAARTRVSTVLAGSVDPELATWTKGRAEALCGSWGEPAEGSATGEVVPPPIYLHSALKAYTRGQIDVHDIARILRSDDAITLQRDLAAAGWVFDSAARESTTTKGRTSQ